MIETQTRQMIAWIENRLQQIEAIAKRLEQAIEHYLQSMTSQGYAPSTQKTYRQVLRRFAMFIKHKRVPWDDIFTSQSIERFQKLTGLSQLPAISGLAQYLFAQGQIPKPWPRPTAVRRLAAVYEDYLLYQQQTRQASKQYIHNNRSVLAVLHDYLNRNQIELGSLKIEHIDAFLAEFLTNLALATCRVYRAIVRGFLRYLYQPCQIITKDLAPLVVGARDYAQARPPKFLRPKEVKKLFAGLTLCLPQDIRTYAMLLLAYSLGLRPIEISRLSLDDIDFGNAQLTVKHRKNRSPVQLPIPDETLKAIAVYMIAARGQSKHRNVFVSLQAPYHPISADTVCRCIQKAMHQANLPASAYWLRHTYAQNLLESGATIFEIKEMLGHDKIESCKHYLHVHLQLMRKVLFDETL